MFPSPSQYELQLRKWEARKNLHVDEWRTILQTVDQYKELGLHYDVYNDGQIIPQSKLKRKRSEYYKVPRLLGHSPIPGETDRLSFTR